MEIDFHMTGKIKKYACEILRVWTKIEENFEKFPKSLRFFDKKSLWKMHFNFLLNISGISASFPNIDCWKIRLVFSNIFPDFRAGRSASPLPPDARDADK